MNQFGRAVADEDHVWIDAALLRQCLSELPALGIWIMRNLLQGRANCPNAGRRKAQRVDAGAKIRDLIDRDPPFTGNLVNIPPMSGLRHLFTMRSHPIPKRTPKRLVQIMSVSALPI